jgi:hypothetical protein
MDKTTNQLLMVVIMVYKPTNITGFPHPVASSHNKYDRGFFERGITKSP